MLSTLSERVQKALRLQEVFITKSWYTHLVVLACVLLKICCS